MASGKIVLISSPEYNTLLLKIPDLEKGGYLLYY